MEPRRPTLTTEMSITIRQDGEDIHTNGALGARSVALLRALLQLKVGQEPHAEPHQPRQDEEALHRAMFDAYVKAPTTNPNDSMAAVISLLRARGLLRTPEDARLVTELRQCTDCVSTLRLEHEQLTRANAALEDRCGRAETSAEDWKNCFDQAMATLKDKESRWAEWSTQAQADLDAANKELTDLRSAKATLASSLAESEVALSRTRQDLETTQAQYVRERDARVVAQAAVQRDAEEIAMLREAKAFYERDRAAWHKKVLEMEARLSGVTP